MSLHFESVRVIKICRRSPDAGEMGDPPMQYAPIPVFDALAARFPEFVAGRGHRIELTRHPADPALETLLRAAVELGLKLPANRAEWPVQVDITDYTAYSLEDIDAAPLVTCQRLDPFIGSVDFEAGSPCIGLHIRQDQWFKKCRNRQIGTMTGKRDLLAVRGAARKALESAGLRGLRLLPLPLQGGSDAWPDGIEPLHVVWSDRMLPEADLELYDNRYRIFRPADVDFKNLADECFPLNGYEQDPPPRYRALDPATFDVAITHERYWGKQECYHKVVYSQKARRVLEKLDGKLIYSPVFITPAEGG